MSDWQGALCCEGSLCPSAAFSAERGRVVSVSKEKKDTVEKEFEGFPDVAADLINALLYQGREVTGADRLLAGPTETIYQGRERLRSQYEDLCKYELRGGRVSAMYLIANQSRVDGRMLLRKAGYTGGVYREQYEGKTKEIFPVVELVLYWGRTRWKGGRSFRELFRKKELPEGLWEHVDDLRLQVFEMRYLPMEVRERFRSDMRIVVDYLAEGEGYCSDRKIVHKAALVKLLRALSGDGDVADTEEELEKLGIREEDEVRVCELFDQYTRKGRREGKEEGRKEGRREGRKEGEARRLVEDIDKLRKNLQLSLERACEVFEITTGSYEEAKRLLQR